MFPEKAITSRYNGTMQLQKSAICTHHMHIKPHIFRNLLKPIHDIAPHNKAFLPMEKPLS